MDLVEKKLNTENKNKSIIVTLTVHILLAFFAFFTVLQKMDVPVEQSFYIDIETEPKAILPPDDSESPILENIPLVNTTTNSRENTAKPNPDPGAAKGNNIAKKTGAVSGTNKNNMPASPKTGGASSEKSDGKKTGEDNFVEDKSSDVALEQKKKYSGLFGSGSTSGSGSGNNNPDGMKGENGGLPNGKALDGLSKGTGRVSGGLNGRGITYTPTFSDNSQRTGRVALIICVDRNGKVTGADFTQKGSTTSDSYLIDLARKTALQYRFVKSEIDSQCGTVNIDFKVI